MKKDMKEVDWETRRYEIAKEVMASRVLSCQNVKFLDINEMSEFAVKYADALINKLKEK